jgi:hypothetical protein
MQCTGQSYGCKGGVLNEEGAADMLAVHVSILQRIKSQVLPTFSHAKRVTQDCPFSEGCPYALYSAIIAKFKALVYPKSDPKVFTLFVSPANDDIPGNRLLMTPANFVAHGCHCPFNHGDDDMSWCQTLAEKVIDCMVTEYPSHIWPLVNGADITCDRAGLQNTCIYKLGEISKVVSETKHITSLISMTALAGLDNVSEKFLVAEHDAVNSRRPCYARPSLPSINRDFMASIVSEFDAWKQLAVAGVDNPIPYMGYFAFLELLEIKEIQATNTIGDSTRAKLLSKKPTHVDVVATAVDAIEIGTNTDVVVKKPENGNLYVPRIVTDEYLREHGFSFDFYKTCATMTERDGYVMKCLENLYKTYLPHLAPIDVQRLVYDICVKHRNDPRVIFDYGICYIPIITRNPRIQSEVVATGVA